MGTRKDVDLLHTVRTHLMRRVTFELSEELHHQMKLHCYAEGIFQGDFLKACVEDYFNQKKSYLKITEKKNE